MNTNPQDFMFAEEIEVMEMLLARAEKRMKWFQEQGQNPNFKCPCGLYEGPLGARKKLGGSCIADMQEFLAMVCRFCQEHGCCQWAEVDEPLPFD